MVFDLQHQKKADQRQCATVGDNDRPGVDKKSVDKPGKTATGEASDPSETEVAGGLHLPRTDELWNERSCGQGSGENAEAVNNSYRNVEIHRWSGNCSWW